MKTMKKLLALVLVVAMTAAIAVNVTLAYLQDEDEAVNTMTLGNVYIEQLEKERVEQTNSGADELQPYRQHKPLLPAVGEIQWVDTADGRVYQKWPTGGASALLDAEALHNVQDKFVFVENTGLSSAYVRTWFAFEAGSMTAEEMNNGLIHWNRNDTHWTWTDFSEDMTATISGVKYYLRVATYTGSETVHPGGVLPAGETTRPSLLQVFLDSQADNALVESLGKSYEILVCSQAIQTQGFASADAALTAGFGAAAAANHPWTDGVTIPNYYPEATPDENGVVTVEAGETLALYGEQAPVTVAGTGTLVLQNVSIDAASGSALTLAAGSEAAIVIEGNTTLTGADGGSGIYVPAGVKLDLSGDTLTAIGNNGTNDGTGADGIGGEGEIYIHDLKDLTAEGWGVHGFGIGGSSASVTIKDTGISNVQGGFVQPNLVNDTSYGKNEPEGGAAIGSSFNGAVITLENVTIENAQGGSKAAGIGAQYHTGCTINIDGCTIKNVVGGNASAGIGGSRVEKGNPNGQNVTINIHNSTITAQGGEFGAGIGSGYDTHCTGPDTYPIHTINITGDSVITATGGKYGAGIGTGYHVGGLAGKIESTVTVNATPGANREKYTKAMAVGFGVVDYTREANGDNHCSFDCQGTIINIASTELVTAQ